MRAFTIIELVVVLLVLMLIGTVSVFAGTGVRGGVSGTDRAFVTGGGGVPANQIQAFKYLDVWSAVADQVAGGTTSSADAPQVRLCSVTDAWGSLAYVGSALLAAPDGVAINDQSVSPTTVASGGAVACSVTATDTKGHAISYQWTATLKSPPHTAGGSFDHPTSASTSWTAPVVTGNTVYLIKVVASCTGGQTATWTSGDITVQPPADAVNISAGPSGVPNPVVSGHTVQCDVTAADTQAHGLTYAWTAKDGAANPAGSFNNATLQNPTWTAPANNTDASVDYTLEVTVSDGHGHSAKKSFTETVSPSADVVSITIDPAGAPNPVASGGTAACSVTASDTHGHGLTYAWTAKDGAANPAGSFDDATKRDPTWTAPANNTDAGVDYTLEVTVSDGHGHSAKKSFTETVSPSADVVSIDTDPAGDPNPVASEGTVACSVSASDTHGHDLTYAWTAKDGADNPAGSFDDATLAGPTWTAPVNNTDAGVDYTLEVTVSDGHGQSAQKSFTETVSPSDDVVSITSGPAGDPNPVASGGTVATHLTAFDTHYHGLTYAWIAKDAADNPAGSFDDATGKEPTWTAPANNTDAGVDYTLEVTVSDGHGQSATESFAETVSPSADVVSIDTDPAGDPNPVASGGTVACSVTASDTHSHDLTYAWTAKDFADNPVGSFDDATLQNPSWTAPANNADNSIVYVLEVTVSDGHGQSATKSFEETVSPSADVVSIDAGPAGDPNPVGSAGSVACSVTASDTHGHGLGFVWSAKDGDGNSAGSFDDTGAAGPTWTAPANNTDAPVDYTLEVLVGDYRGHFDTASFTETVSPSPDLVILMTGPSGNPNAAASSGLVQLSAGATDSHSHALAYRWTAWDAVGNPAGSFDDSTLQNPVWTAPANLGPSVLSFRMRLVVSCANTSCMVSYWQNVMPVTHAIVLSAGPTASPNPVAGRAQVQLGATATDSSAHLVTYLWTAKDGAGNSVGSFDDATLPNPIWTAPSNPTNPARTYTITVKATCAKGKTVSAFLREKVVKDGLPLELSAAPSGSPNPVASGGTVACSANASDNNAHSMTYLWTAKNGAGDPVGSFDDATLANPVWTAPANPGATNLACTLAVTVTCPVSSVTASFRENVRPVPPVTDAVTITGGPYGTPNPVASEGQAQMYLTATDSLGHALTYAWTATDGAGHAVGSFNDPAAQNPIWTAPANTSGVVKQYSLKVFVTCSAGKVRATTFVQKVLPAPPI
ncbi:MAG TPA: hypothetical protein VGM19_12630 [Armatimonadota bacterium]